MLRAAAKNFGSVTVVPSPEFYEEVLAALESEGQVPEETRRRLALAAFRRTAEYDAAISGWLGERVEGETESSDSEAEGFPERRTYIRAGLGPALRGEPAPGCGLLR